MQGEEARNPGRGWWRAILSALVLVAYLLFALLDPFGVEGAIKRHAYQAASRIAGLCYLRPLCLGWYGDDWRSRTSQVAVVLIDDAYMAERDGGWPVSWRHHAGLLRSIADLQPRAIFLDFAYHRPRVAEEGGQVQSPVHRQLSWSKEGVWPPPLPPAQADIDALRMAIEEVQDDFKIPVVLGEIPLTGRAPPNYWERKPALRSLYERRCAADQTPQAPGEKPLGPQRQEVRPLGNTDAGVACAATALAPITSASGSNPFLYPLMVEPFGSDPLLPAHPTPAPALLRAAGEGHRVGDLEREDRMLVAWRLRGSGLELQRHSGNCDLYSPVLAVVGSLLPGIEQNWITRTNDRLADDRLSGRERTGVISGRPETKVEPCLAIDTVSALAVDRFPDAPAAPDGPRVRDVLKDRFVLLGSGRGAGDPDRVRTPAGGEVPGVLLHAMALDNLLHFAPGHYWKLRESGWLYDLTYADLAGLVALVLAMGSKYILDRTVAARRDLFSTRERRWLARRTPFVVTFLTVMVFNHFYQFGSIEVLVSSGIVTAFKAASDFFSTEPSWLASQGSATTGSAKTTSATTGAPPDRPFLHEQTPIQRTAILFTEPWKG